ncbi:MAG: hypothetical protein ACYSSP_07175 [Planctomycetota bacterium]|jgi:hypothetical protein
MAVQKGKQTLLLTILLYAVLLTVCFAQTGRGTVQEKRAKALELVEQYTQALDSTASFIEHYERTGEYRGRFPPSHPYYLEDESKGFHYKPFTCGIRKFEEDKGHYLSEYAWGYFNTDNKNVPEDKAIYRIWIRNREFAYFHQTSKNPSSIGSCRTSKDSSEIKAHGYIAAGAGLGHLIGYVETGERLDKVLRKASRISLREETEHVVGSECFVIDAHTKYGQFSLWLDPDHGWHAVKIRKSAKTGDSFARPGRIIPKGSVYTSYLDVLEFKKVNGIWIPVEANAGFHRTIGSPEYYMAEDVRYKRTQVILNPDHESIGSFADPIFEDPRNDPELVNGTLYEVDTDSRPIYHTWQDGKLFDDDGKPVDMDTLEELLEAQEKED